MEGRDLYVMVLYVCMYQDMPESLFPSVCVCVCHSVLAIYVVSSDKRRITQRICLCVCVHVCEVKYAALRLGRVVIHPYISPVFFCQAKLVLVLHIAVA